MSQLRVGLFHLHCTAAHGDHLKQGDGLHASPFTMAASRPAAAAVASFGTVALDIL